MEAVEKRTSRNSQIGHKAVGKGQVLSEREQKTSLDFKLFENFQCVILLWHQYL